MNPGNLINYITNHSIGEQIETFKYNPPLRRKLREVSHAQTPIFLVICKYNRYLYVIGVDGICGWVFAVRDIENFVL